MNDESPGNGARDAEGAEAGVGAVWRFGAPAAVALVGAFALARAWSFGPDLQIDFGRELHLPWRVSQGDRLYLDLAHWGGPLSVTWHAFLFGVFGPSLALVKASNAAACAVIAASIYVIANRFAGSVVALVTAGFFVGCLAFAQLLPLANYDYLTPYAHELTHGLALALLGLALRVSLGSVGSRRPTVAWVCGVLLGAVAATKVEVLFAYAAALFVAFGWPCLVGAPEARLRARHEWGRLALGFAVSVAVITLAVASHSGWQAAWLGWLEPWRVLLGTDVASLPFYRHTMGTLDPGASLLRLFQGSVLVGLGCAGIALVAIGWRRFMPRWAIYPAVFVWLAVFWQLPMTPGAMRLLLAPVGWIAASLLGLALFEARRSRDADRLGLAALLTFAVVLTAKMALNARLSHYGFALFMPATLVCVAALVGVFPGAIARRGGSREAAVLLGTMLVVSVGLGLHTQSERHRAARTAEVGRGDDVMRADFRAHAFNRALAHLLERPPDTTVAVLPEGVMLNYLSRRETPTRYINFMPPELAMYGEAAIVDALRTSPPDLIVLMHKRAGLYGTPDFGTDYGRALDAFAREHYRHLETWGGEPFDPATRFGISVWERR